MKLPPVDPLAEMITEEPSEAMPGIPLPAGLAPGQERANLALAR